MNRIQGFKSIASICFLLAGIIQPSISFAVWGCIDLTKEVSSDGGISWYDANTESEAVSITSGAVYKFTVLKCDLDRVENMAVVDDVLSIYQGLEDFLGAEYDPITGAWIPNPDAIRSFTINAPDICANHEGLLLNTATVTGTGLHHMELLSDSDDAWIRCEPSYIGGEGCTPGYWKQEHHFDSWPYPVTPDTLFSTVFDRSITIKTKTGAVINPTLAEALAALGGKINTVARHSTAAYLNALSDNVNYDLDDEQIIESFQIGFDSDNFAFMIIVELLY